MNVSTPAADWARLVFSLMILVLISTRGEADDSANKGLRIVADTVVDSKAHVFAKGRFGTCINGQTFQQEALVTFKGYQYAGYFGAGGKVCVARRSLDDSNWQTLCFHDYPGIKHRDAHNVVVIGICPADGTLHLAFDHHNNPLHYRRSVKNLALKPDQFEWTAKHFGKTTSALEEGKTLNGLTYPMFVSTPDKKLQFMYRLGSSGNGDWYLAEYQPDRGNWKTLGMLFTRQGKYQSSASRCAYPNPLRYDAKGRLHVTWCWRERPKNQPFDLRTNHDLCYAYSDDLGRSWKNNAGELIARLDRRDEKTPASIGINTPGIVVKQTKFLWGQMNTTTEFVDSKGRVHVIHWQHDQQAEASSKDLDTWRYYYYRQDAKGQWQATKLPFHGRKPQIVVDDQGVAYVFYIKGADANYHHQDPGGTLHLSYTTRPNQFSNWKTISLSDTTFFGEPLLDLARWIKERRLSVYIQQKPKEGATSSPLHVLEIR